MGDYWLSVLNSVFANTSLFLVFSLVLSFWGRLVLWLAKLEKNPRLGEPLTLLTGGALVVFMGWCLYGLVENYRNYLLIVLYSGAALLFLELLFWRWPVFWRKKDKVAAVKNLLVSHQPLLAAIILALIFSFFHSAIWESGQMEVWLYGSTDYLNWSQLADYWLGLVDPVAHNWNYNVLVMTRDSIGSLIMLALWALASGETALFSISGFLVAMVIWSALFIQALTRRVFGLGFWLSLAITLSVVGGSFFNYLIFKGLVGQLVATVAYLAALTEILAWRGQPDRKELAQFFIPVFYLFLSYQGAFAAYAFFLALAGVVVYYFRQGRQGREADAGKILAWAKRVGRSLKGARPVLVATLFSFLLAPFMAWHLYARTLEVALRSSGWRISFVNPWLLSGLPIYRPQFFTQLTDQAPVYGYLLFFVILVGLGYLVNRSVKNEDNESDPLNSKQIDIKAIKSLISLLIISIVIYIFGYYIFDNRYHVWKFISYMGLPLAFVPMALLALLVVLLSRRRQRALARGLVFGSVALLTLVLGVGLDNLKDLTKVPKVYYGSMSAKSFLSVLRKIIFTAEPGTHFMVNFTDLADTLFAAEFFKNNSKYKFSLMNRNLFFNANEFFPIILSKKSKYIIISDRNYDKLYNNSQGKREIRRLYVNDPAWVSAYGYVDIQGVDRARDWRVNKDWVLLKILVPEALRGENALLTVKIKNGSPNLAACRPKARLAIAAQGEKGIWEDLTFNEDIGAIKTLVQGSITGEGLIIASVLLAGDFKGSEDSPSSPDCAYYFQGVELGRDN
ncbi:MAG: hypothetical protein LBT86_07055 [Deltaproteobacteria bacterium]|jgi:hypothetical protein|nr:hypothetical protein [Deltaproteobacteria bacterium]